MRLKAISGIMLTLFLVSMLSTVMPVSAGGIPEDVNGDGTVNINDVLRVALAFGSSTVAPNILGHLYDPAADVDQNGIINIFDLARVAIHFGEDC